MAVRAISLMSVANKQCTVEAMTDDVTGAISALRVKNATGRPYRVLVQVGARQLRSAVLPALTPVTDLAITPPGDGLQDMILGLTG